MKHENYFRLLAQEDAATQGKITHRIAVGGAKCGSGTSNLVGALAVLTRNCGYKVAIRVQKDCRSPLYDDRTCLHGIEVLLDDEVAVNDYDFLFTDLPSGALCPYAEAERNYLVLAQDLIVVPFDLFTSEIALLLKIFGVLKSLPSGPPWIAVHVSPVVCVNRFFRNAKHLLDFEGFILREGVTDELAVFSPDDAFTSEDQEDLLRLLMREICEHLGAALDFDDSEREDQSVPDPLPHGGALET